MDDLTYQPPLRGAMIRLMREGLPVSERLLAEQAGVAIERARAYISILIQGRVIRRDDKGDYRTGPKWQEWSSRATKARPHRSNGGNTAEMDRLRRVLAHNVKREMEARQWTQYRLSKEAGVSEVAVRRLLTRCIPPPLASAVLISRALGKPIEELMGSNC